ncbi:MAG: hypothetical protein ACKVUT_12845 [Gaiella sp.]
MSELVLSLERFEAGEQAVLDREAVLTALSAHGAVFDELGWATLACADGGQAEISVSSFDDVYEAVVYLEQLTPALSKVLFEAVTAASLCVTVAAVPDAPVLAASPAALEGLPDDDERPQPAVCWSADDFHTMLRHAAGSLADDPLVPPIVEHPVETQPVDRADLLRQAFSRFRRP